MLKNQLEWCEVYLLTLAIGRPLSQQNLGADVQHGHWFNAPNVLA